VIEQAIEAILVLKLVPAIMLLVHPTQKKPPPTAQQMLLMKLSKTPILSPYDAALSALTEIANNSAAATAIVNVDVPEGPTILLTICNSYLSPTRDHIERKEESLWVLLSAIKAMVRRTVRGVLDAAQVQELFTSLDRLKDKTFSAKISNLLREMLHLNEDKEEKPSLTSSSPNLAAGSKIVKTGGQNSPSQSASSLMASPRETVMGVTPPKSSPPSASTAATGSGHLLSIFTTSPGTSPSASPSVSPRRMTPPLTLKNSNDQDQTTTTTMTQPVTIPDIISSKFVQTSQQQPPLQLETNIATATTTSTSTTPPPENLVANEPVLFNSNKEGDSGNLKGNKENSAPTTGDTNNNTTSEPTSSTPLQQQEQQQQQ